MLYRLQKTSSPFSQLAYSHSSSTERTKNGETITLSEAQELSQVPDPRQASNPRSHLLSLPSLLHCSSRPTGYSSSEACLWQILPASRSSYVHMNSRYRNLSHLVRLARVSLTSSQLVSIFVKSGMLRTTGTSVKVLLF